MIQELDRERAAAQTPKNDSEIFRNTVAPTVVDDYAFAFDVDGVLVRGGSPLREAKEAMRILNGQNEYNVKV